MAYSPLGHGFFGGKGVVESLPTESFLVYDKHMSVWFGFVFISFFLISDKKNNEMFENTCDFYIWETM